MIWISRSRVFAPTRCSERLASRTTWWSKIVRNRVCKVPLLSPGTAKSRALFFRAQAHKTGDRGDWKHKVTAGLKKPLTAKIAKKSREGRKEQLGNNTLHRVQPPATSHELRAGTSQSWEIATDSHALLIKDAT